MPKRTCSKPGCDSPHVARGLCKQHYRRARASGALDVLNLTETERFWTHVEKTSGCWLWVASRASNGYGQFEVARNGMRKNVRAHRYSFELATGPIPDALQVDHLCFVRHCVNPAHLRLVNAAQNMQHRRGANPNNTSSGVRGVVRTGSRVNPWGARISQHNKSIWLGSFPTIAAAEAAVVAARRAVYTHDDAHEWLMG